MSSSGEIHNVQENKSVFYQIYIRAFYDSDGDGIGDIQGVIQKLDYLEDLGVGGLWLMPLFRAPTNHKYFSNDFWRVDPEYGSNDDLKELVQEAHKRDIQVLIDFMVNHTSNEHPWFHLSTLSYKNYLKGNIKKDESKYLQYYHWAYEDNKEIKIPETYTHEGQLVESHLSNWKKAESITGEPVGLYYSRFVDAPDLNYDNPEVRKEIKEVAKFWVGEMGVDGIRLDAARHIYDCEAEEVMTPQHRNYIWWSEFCKEVRSVKPECLIIGEIWNNAEVMSSYLPTGMSSLFDFDLSEAIQKSVLDEKNQSIVQSVQNMEKRCKEYNPDYINSTFVTTHDFSRLMTMMNENEGKVRLAISILLTLPGRPFIYYGDEIGLKADAWLTWLSMPWDISEKDSGQTDWMETPLKFTQDIIPVSKQIKNKHSLYWHVRNLIHFRNNHPILRMGNIDKSEIEDPQIVSYTMSLNHEDLLVLHNLSPIEKRVHIDVKNYKIRKLIYPVELNHNGEYVTLSPYGTIVLQ